MTDKKALLLEIKDLLEKIENRINLSILENEMRKILEEVYTVLK